MENLFNYDDLTGCEIMVVDDIPDNLRLLVGILKKHNYKIRPVSSGPLAISAAKLSPPDIILLDINMPEMNGYDVCRELKKEPVTSEIPVIFLSAMNETIDKVKAFESGGVDYISKPFHVEEVLIRVKTHLKLYMFQKNLENTNLILEKKVKERTEEIIKLNSARERFECELKVAEKIQTAMLPKSLTAEQRKQIDVHAYSKPAKHVGGDFYDYFFISPSKFFFCVGDVSGKGVPAALFMASVNTLIKVEAHKHSEPHEIVMNVNNLISSDNPTCMFASLLCGVVDFDKKEIKYCNAGHMPPLISEGQNPFEFTIFKKESVIGLFKSFDYDYTTEAYTYVDKTAIFLYSDGVNEAIDTKGRQYSRDRLKLALNNAFPLKSSEDVVIHVVKELDSFTGSEPQSDDITILVVQL